MAETEEKTFSIEEVMERIGMSRAQIYGRIKEKKLKGAKTDHAMRFGEADVETFEAALLEERSGFQEALAYWLTFYAERLSQQGEEDLPDLEEKTDDERVAELGRRLVLDGILAGASDIYLDPLHSGDRLLHRSEGVLREIGRMEGTLPVALKGKLKALTPLTVREGEQVAEGLFQVTHDEQVHQIRIMVAPTLLGEHIHLHMYESQERVSIEALGYTSAQADALRGLLTGRPGLFLVAGAADPTADRHRLALATALTASGRLVVSLEHRIQYRSELLVQLEIGEQEALGFDAMLRMALGMGPDVLLFDEVRDEVEAQGLLEASYGGAVVVAQTRAPGGVEMLLHLVELGLSRDSLARALLGMVERVALRRLCPHCRTSREATSEEAELLGASVPLEVGRSQRCDVCGDGFLGRRVLYGLWPMDEDLGQRIRSLEPPGTALIEWRDRHPLSVKGAVREAVLAGDVLLEDARFALRGVGAHVEESA